MTDVGKPNGLTKRKGSNSYYFRRRFPSDVAARTRQAAFMQSLRTGIYAEALKKLPAAEEAYLAELRRLRSSPAPPPTKVIIHLAAEVPVRNLAPDLPELTSEAARRLARQYFDAERAKLDQEHIGWGLGEDWEREVEEVEHHLAALSDPDDPNGARWTEASEIDLLDLHRLRADPSTEASLLLRQLLRRAMWQIGRLRRSRLDGDYCDRITDAFFTSPGRDAAPTPTAATPTISIGELIKRYDAEHIEPEEFSAKTAMKRRSTLAIVARFFGAETAVTAIDRDACYDFRDTLGNLPPNLVKRFGREAGLKNIALENAASGGRVMDRQTQEQYLRALSRLFAFAAERRHTSENMAENIGVRGGRRNKRRKEAARNSYSKEQLRKIFTAPLYTGCKDDEHGYATPGPNIIRRSRFWVPLIGLFTGLRLEEILQLTVDHVREGEDGLPFLHITPDMRVKTENGYRQVPVHSELVRIGFMALVKQAKAHEEGRLFIDVPPGSDQSRSTVYSKRYATFSRSIKLHELGRKVSFHSFRHSFRDALRRPDVNPDLVKELGGWSRGSETSSAYGDGAPAHVLRPLVEGIEYGVDLKHLYVVAD